jgi:NTE family protein
VRALKVIEEAGIPVDLIVGTSMGSIVGGLYASGYTADQLDSLIRSQNWQSLLTDKADRQSIRLEEKQNTEKYMLNLRFDKSPFEVMEGGVLKGNKIGRLFSELTADRLDYTDFSRLPIPFACVATDIVTGKEVEIHSGILAEAMRTSMAIPGVFSPIKRDSMVLVDGGLTNIFPVDVARKMGADIVIGVDVTSPGREYGQFKSASTVLLQVLDIACANKLNENRNNTDLYIRVDVNGYTSASFTGLAIDTLLARGEKAARKKWDELISLKPRIGIGSDYVPHTVSRKPKHISIDRDTFVPVPSIYSERRKASFVGIGARFDNEELATLLVGGAYEFNVPSHLRIGLEARLGKRLNTKLHASIEPWKRWRLQLFYEYALNDTKLYNEGDNIADLNYHKHTLNLSLSRSWRQLRLRFGTNYSYVHFDDLLTHHNWANFAQQQENEGTFSYFFEMQYDNQDSRVLPRRGMKWSVLYRYNTDNCYNFNGHGGVNTVEGYWNVALPLAAKTILTPCVSGRIVQNRNTYFSLSNFVGGVGTYSHYMPQQQAFAGINFVQIAPNELLILGLSARQYFTTNSYCFAIVNYGFAGYKFRNFIDGKNMIGAAIGGGYKTPVGPIELNLNWSNITRMVGAFFNIGYMF